MDNSNTEPESVLKSVSKPHDTSNAMRIIMTFSIVCELLLIILSILILTQTFESWGTQLALGLFVVVYWYVPALVLLISLALSIYSLKKKILVKTSATLLILTLAMCIVILGFIFYEFYR